jgi:O-antigen ligase
MIASLVIMIIRLNYKFRKRKVVSTKSMVILVSFISIASSYLARKTNNTLTGRTFAWESYLEIWRSSPIVGVGVQLRSVESSFIWTLAAMGLTGLICLLSVFYLTFRSIPKELTPDVVLPFALFTWIIVRCSTEASYVFYSWDSATLAILCAIASSRLKASSIQNSFELKTRSF